MAATQTPDRHVFQLLLILTLLFMVAYVLGTSIPAWYQLDVHVTNISTCDTADRYLETHVRQNRNEARTHLIVSASLWYMMVDIDLRDRHVNRWLPFVTAPGRTEVGHSEKYELTSYNIASRGIISLLTFTFLSMGVVFAFTASPKPSKLVYYGLSAVLIVAGITTWLTVAIPSSQERVLSTAMEFCLVEASIATSVFIHILTGAAAVIAFILGCILIHLALLTNAMYTQQREDDEQLYDVGVYEKVIIS